MWLTTQAGSSINTDLFVAVNVKGNKIFGQYADNKAPYQIAEFESPELALAVYHELQRSLSSGVKQTDISQMMSKKERKAQRRAINLAREAKEKAERDAKLAAAAQEAKED
jgi:hypothetical protein